MIFSVVRASRSLTVTLRKEGQVELSLGRRLTQLGAARYCETCRNAVNTIFRREDAFFCSPHGNDKMIYEIKSTANSCIALCSSTNAVSISSARTTNRFSSRSASAIRSFDFEEFDDMEKQAERKATAASYIRHEQSPR
jgi:hypothetical protein